MSQQNKSRCPYMVTRKNSVSEPELAQMPQGFAAIISCMQQISPVFLQESVLVEFFEESLCPYCAQFSTKVLGPLLSSNLTPFIDFQLVPYGNAKQTSQV